MLRDLFGQFKIISNTKVDQTDYAKVVIMSAEGPVFSAGHDLKEMAQVVQAHKNFDDFGYAAEMMQFMQQDLPQITIAAVNNFATAAGCQLVASCDLLLASKSAKFSCPGIKIGLFCSTPAVATSRAMGNQKKGFEMLVTGDTISGEEAYKYGLANRFVEKDEDLLSEALKLAQKIVVHSGETLALGKKRYYQQKQLPLSDAYQLAVKTMIDNIQLEDCQEGINSFVEKRHPHFKK